jgi:hypothetical protein
MIFLFNDGMFQSTLLEIPSGGRETANQMDDFTITTKSTKRKKSRNIRPADCMIP